MDRVVKVFSSGTPRVLSRLIIIGWLVLFISDLITRPQTDLMYLVMFALSGISMYVLLTEARYIDLQLRNRFRLGEAFDGITITVIGCIGVVVGFYFALRSNTSSSLNSHSLHQQIAQESQQIANASSSNPALQGDRTRRFTVDLDYPDKTKANQPTQLSFRVFDASSGNVVALFSPVFEKAMHLIVVNSGLSEYQHLHPIQTGASFEIPVTFATNDIYHIYIDFQPIGAIEQQFAFTINVGDVVQSTSPASRPDTNLTKSVDQYQVNLSLPQVLRADQISLGKQNLTFTIADHSGRPVTTLKPYLASFGHLVMINQATYDYLHAHPTNAVTPQIGEISGPDVSFMPLGLYGPIKPGIYRIFAQFNPNGQLITADFTIAIE